MATLEELANMRPLAPGQPRGKEMARRRIMNLEHLSASTRDRDPLSLAPPEYDATIPQETIEALGPRISNPDNPRILIGETGTQVQTDAQGAPRPPQETAQQSTPEQRGYLQPGDQGPGVRSLKEKMRATGYYEGDLDETYGSDLAKSVKKFQKDYNLRVDALYGDQTSKILDVVSQPGKGPGVQDTPNLRLPQEPIEQQAVPEAGEVIRNQFNPQTARFLAELGSAIAPQGTVGQRLGQTVSGEIGRRQAEHFRQAVAGGQSPADVDTPALSPAERQAVLQEFTGQRQLALEEDVGRARIETLEAQAEKLRRGDPLKLETFREDNDYVTAWTNPFTGEVMEVARSAISSGQNPADVAERMTAAQGIFDKKLNNVMKTMMNENDIIVDATGNITFSPENPIQARRRMQRSLIPEIRDAGLGDQYVRSAIRLSAIPYTDLVGLSEQEIEQALQPGDFILTQTGSLEQWNPETTEEETE